MKESVPAVEGLVESAGMTDDDFLEYTEELLKNYKNFVGKGNISEVYRLDTNERICVKITDESEDHGTVNYALRGERPYFNSVSVESDFLVDLQGVDSEVRVPKPYYFLKKFVGRPDGSEAAVSVLAMELLDAVSVDDVVQGREELPSRFDLESFCKKLAVFFDKIHDRGVYHRDVHSGNIMIGRKNGEPYVIDFGSAAHGTEEDVYRGSYRGAETPFRRDETGLDLVRKSLKDKLTEINK